MHIYPVKRKGITPIIATIVLLFITMSLVVTSYTLIYGMSGALAKTCLQIPVTSPPSCINGKVNVIIYNCGSEPIAGSSIDTIEFNNTNLVGSTYITQEPIAPGKSKPLVVNFECDNPPGNSPCGGQKTLSISIGSVLEKRQVDCGGYTRELNEKFRFVSHTAGGSEIRAISESEGYIYVGGFVGQDSAVMKLDQLLSESCAGCAKKIYEAGTKSTIYDLYIDDTFVYAAAKVLSGTDYDMLLFKLDKSDMSLVASKRIAMAQPESSEVAIGGDAEYIYVVGTTTSGLPSFGNTDAYIVKIRKSDLAVITSKIFGGTEQEKFSDLIVESEKIYTVGFTGTLIAQRGLIYEINKADLSTIRSKKVNTIRTEFEAITSDESFIYIAGWSINPSSGIVVKLAKSDLSAVSYVQKEPTDIYSYFYDIVLYGDRLYVVGETSELYPISSLVMALSKEDLSHLDNKAFGVVNPDWTYERIFGVEVSDGKVYAGGFTEKTDSYTSGMLIFKLSEMYDGPAEPLPPSGTSTGDYMTYDVGGVISSSMALVDSGLNEAGFSFVESPQAISTTDALALLSEPYTVAEEEIIY